MTRNMTNRRDLLGLAGTGLVAAILFTRSGMASPKTAFEVTHSSEEWRRMLGAQRYAVLRQAGTERPFTSPLSRGAQRRVRLRGLRIRPVLLDDEVRQRHRLAELLGAAAECGRTSTRTSRSA